MYGFGRVALALRRGLWKVGSGVFCCAWLASACTDAADSCTTDFPRNYPDAGECDDSEPARVDEGKAIKQGYAVTCDSQALDAGGCEGLPNDIWGRCSLRRCEAKRSYPEGCIVWLPTQNPYYPGSAQNCTCMPSTSSHELRWSCGL
jgi:hypothetical protein